MVVLSSLRCLALVEGISCVNMWLFAVQTLVKTRVPLAWLLCSVPKLQVVVLLAEKL